MKRILMPLVALSLALPVTAQAKANPGNGNGHGQVKHVNVGPGHARNAPGQAQGCPPGLAKKSPACVPPGLAKNGVTKNVYPQVGDRLDGQYYGSRYVLVRDPGRYGLEPYGTYYRIDGQVFQVDRETSEVLALIGAVSAILN